MKLFLRFKFWVLRKFNDGNPSRQEVAWAITKYKHTERINQAMGCYADGLTYEQTAELLGVTRERIRQLIFKGTRQSRTVLFK